MSDFARKIKRNQLRAVLVAQARAEGCTCEPDITLPRFEPGKVRVATVAHDMDCPHRTDSSDELAAKINSGAWDSDGAGD